MTKARIDIGNVLPSLIMICVLDGLALKENALMTAAIKPSGMMIEKY